MKKGISLIIMVIILSLNGCMKTDSNSLQSPTVTAAIPDATGSSSVDQSGPEINTSANSPSESQDNPSPTISSGEETPIVVNEIDDEQETFFIGQSYMDASTMLYDSGIDITQGTDFLLNTDKYELSFSEGKLYEILVTESSKLPTTKGLNFGDSPDQMISLYGTEYTECTEKNYPNITEYLYVISDHYFHVEFQDNKVSVWGISEEDNG